MEHTKILNKLQKVYDMYNGDPRADQYEMELLNTILERGTIEDDPVYNGFITYADDMELIQSWFDWYDGISSK